MALPANALSIRALGQAVEVRLSLELASGNDQGLPSSKACICRKRYARPDALIGSEELEQWRRNPQFLIRDELGRRQEFPESQRERCAHAFSDLKAMPDVFPKVVMILKQYVRQCIPAFSRTEQDFWSLSCLPSTYRSTWPRFAAISLAMMETLVLEWDATDQKITRAFVNVAESGLSKDLEPLRTLHAGLSLEKNSYRSAGDDQITLSIEPAWAMLDLLHEPEVEVAARELNLRLMRRGRTAYSRFHYPLLAEAAIGG